MGFKINGIPVAGLGLPGKDGDEGRSAYQIAQDGGYQGSEAEFAELLATAASQSYVEQEIGEHNQDENAHSDIRQAVSSAASAASTAQTAAQNAQAAAESKAPMYTYGTEDLTAGTSPLASGQLHFVYE